jgi:hypothetical protein
MSPDDKQAKINALTFAKDELEKSMAILKAEGYTQYSDVTKRVQCGIDLLRMDIRGLQNGTLPLVKFNKIEKVS